MFVPFPAPPELPQAALPAPEVIELTRRLSSMLMLVALLGIVLIASLILVILQRRRERHRHLDSLRAIDPNAPRPSPWEEAGRRMAVPPEFEVAAPDASAPQDSDPRRTTPRSLRHDAGAVPLPKHAGGNISGGPLDEPLPADPLGASQRPVALITGGAKRVGRATALAFARAGFDVIFTYNTSEQQAQELCRTISSLGRQATSFRIDLSDADEVTAFASQLARTLPRLDVLVHNASSYEPSPLDDFDSASAHRQMRINALAPLTLSAALATLLQHSPLSGGGSIVALLDVHAMARPRRTFAAYEMSKAALEAMVLSLARDLAPAVRVNAVAPGVVAWHEDSGERSPEQRELEQSRYLKRIPLARFGEPDDAANAILWLATRATYTTGQVIRIDGGRWLT